MATATSPPPCPFEPGLFMCPDVRRHNPMVSPSSKRLPIIVGRLSQETRSETKLKVMKVVTAFRVVDQETYPSSLTRLQGQENVNQFYLLSEVSLANSPIKSRYSTIAFSPSFVIIIIVLGPPRLRKPCSILM